jgi:hypothetical protein
MSNICKAFEMSDKDKQREHLRKLVLVENFGDECNGKALHTWDDGCRILKRCPECDALVLCQYSEFHDFTGGHDKYYNDYFSVDSREEALALNEKYNGFQIEMEYKGKKIFL